VQIEALDLHLVHDKGNRKDGKWWINFPRRSYEGRDGKTHWQTLLEFNDKAIRERFQKLALQALRFRYPEVFATVLPPATDDSAGREHLAEPGDGGAA
jgi:hypothetical protein